MKRLVSMLLVSALVLLLAPGAAPAETSKEEPGVTVYFPNWNIYSDERCSVSGLPWDRLDCVNHAFWEVAPQDGGFALVSTDPWADVDPDNPDAHFAQYAQCAEKYPGVKILVSVGGWTDCGCFSEMALTAESRGTFIKSCLETLDAYPFLSGLDIDWEYPGVAREPEDDEDEGCPVVGDDRTNYTLLLKELREAMDEHFGPGKILTVCAGASPWTLSMQDYASLHVYVDRINLMTYDMAGPWDDCTGHHTALYGENSAEASVQYLLEQGVPTEKIAIGSPLYSHGWKLNAPAENPAGVAAEALDGGDLTWHELLPLEQAAVPEGTPGWHACYDEKKEAAWLWNDDPDSPDYLTFYTYESAASLDAKLAYVNEHDLGGLIVWQVHGDSIDGGWPMITRMYNAFHP